MIGLNKEIVLKTVSELFDTVKDLQTKIEYESLQTECWRNEYLKAVAENNELQKQLIDQGQRFNEQSQLVKDLEFKLVKPNAVETRLSEYINQLEGTLKGNLNSTDRQLVQMLIKNLDFCLNGERSK